MNQTMTLIGKFLPRKQVTHLFGELMKKAIAPEPEFQKTLSVAIHPQRA